MRRIRRGFILGFAAGYLVGSAAGRQRYEQIVRVFRSLRTNPTVRRTATSAEAFIRSKLDKAGDGRGPMDQSDGPKHLPRRQTEVADLVGPGVNV